MKQQFMKTKWICTILLGLAISGCGRRVIPDELVLIKYQPLQMPNALNLPVPDADAKPLGYQTSRTKITNIVKPKEVVIQDISQDKQTQTSAEILRLLQLKNVNMNTSNLLQKPMGERVIVIIDQEKQRLAQNIANDLPLTNGNVPRILAKRTEAGIDQLFEDD